MSTEGARQPSAGLGAPTPGPQPPAGIAADGPRALADVERGLVNRFWNRLRVFGVRRLGDASLAEDLAQETLRRVTEALRTGRLESVEALPGFVFQTATHLCLHHYRARGREERAFGRLSREHPAGAAAMDALDGLVNDETRQAVRDAMSRLDRNDQEVLRRAYFVGEDSDAIGQALGLTPGAVRVRKHRALGRLAELLGSRPV